MVNLSKYLQTKLSKQILHVKNSYDYAWCLYLFRLLPDP
jgi:hypothetical protein